MKNIFEEKSQTFSMYKVMESLLRLQFMAYINKFQVRKAQTTVLKGHTQSFQEINFSEILKNISECLFQTENFYKSYSYSDQVQSVRCICGNYLFSYSGKCINEALGFGG